MELKLNNLWYYNPWLTVHMEELEEDKGVEQPSVQAQVV